MEREYYEDLGYKPFLYFVVFGVAGEELKVSRERHQVDEFPEGLEIHSLSRSEHADYLDGLLGGQIGKVLSVSDEELYNTCVAAENVVVITGTVQEDSTLDYMRNVIGIIQAFVEQGAVGVLDLLTFTLYEPERWTERFFGKDVNAQRYVMVLVSDEEDGSVWLHTRGMAEFGRPDIGIHNVPQELVDDYKQVVDQMIFYGGKGLFFRGKARLHTFSGKSFVVKPAFVNDFENDDFNNAYYDVTVLDEE